MVTLLLAIFVQSPATVQVAGYERTEVMIPMRDGVKLHTVIERPVSASGPLPILLHRTPYGAGFADVMARRVNDFDLPGYILVGQDIRGRFESQGTFDMNRPPRSAARGVDESTDSYDTIDWLVKNVKSNNGKVGTIGVSYPGWLTAVTGMGAHPALKAVSPQAPMGDTWMGDDFFHQGAWRQSYGTEYTWSMEATNTQDENPSPSRYDLYDWYLSFPTLDSLGKTIRADRFPTWRRFVGNPTYDSAWQSRCLPCYMKHATVPTLVVGGWWDQEDEYGPIAHFKSLHATDTAGIVHLVMGPWYHGQWSTDSGVALGNARFGRPTGVEYRAMQKRFFDHYLKGVGDGQFPTAWVFDAGTNDWRSFASWPPANAQHKNLYFHANGVLSFDPPADAEAAAADSFVSDPAHPVPYRPRPVELTYSRTSRWRRWETEDQRFVDGRPDVLTWQTPPLTDSVIVAGNVVAKLFAATTGSDADWVVKLIDVYPDSVPGRPDFGGYELMITGDIMRGRYYKSWETPAAIPASQVTPFTVDLHQQSYTFRRGHRIMVQVQSTWFPLYDKNPQTFVPNIFKAGASDYKAQTHRVYRTAQNPSHVEVDVLTP
ncbi:MAG TPA: CocE/NonD family hydrolase [Gemmatimonadales bacterium]|nr:CocE/NonD family hydrolase [Gemmatimonadales bacterium]